MLKQTTQTATPVLKILRTYLTKTRFKNYRLAITKTHTLMLFTVKVTLSPQNRGENADFDV